MGDLEGRALGPGRSRSWCCSPPARPASPRASCTARPPSTRACAAMWTRSCSATTWWAVVTTPLVHYSGFGQGVLAGVMLGGTIAFQDGRNHTSLLDLAGSGTAPP